MLVDAPEQAKINVAVIVESDDLISCSFDVASKIWRSGLSCEITSTGSPKKRWEKATKFKNPDLALSLSPGMEGRPSLRVRYYAKYPQIEMPSDEALRSLFGACYDLQIERKPVTLWADRPL